MNKHGANETVGFNNLHSGYIGNYYGYLSTHQGYGGFNYAEDILFMNRSTWTAPDGIGYQSGWCGTGFQYACEGKGEAWIDKSGFMESAKPTETFTLKSMIAASAWDTDAKWEINSYTYSDGTLMLKASDVLTISQTAEKVNFAGLGGKTDFRDISAVSFVLMAKGGGGSTCNTVGQPTYGYQLSFDNLKVHWNGKIPKGGHVLPAATHAHHHVSPLPIPPVRAALDHAAAQSADDAHHDPGSYRSQIASLDAALGHADPGAGITDQFALPQVQHFGS
jgi:hypothetical protein